MKLQKIVKKQNLWRQIAKVLNGVNDLSPREMEIFSILLKFNHEWKPLLPSDTKNILTRETRRAIMHETKINKNNLSKYLSNLKERGLIVKNQYGGYEVHKLFTPYVTKDNIVRIIFTIGVKDD